MYPCNANVRVLRIFNFDGKKRERFCTHAKTNEIG